MNNLATHLHHFFAPKESNNYKAKTLHLDFLTAYLVLALIFSIGVKQLKAGSVLGYATDITVDKLLELTNQERANNGIPPLKYNDKLSAAANSKAQNMFANGYWAHFAPDGTTPWSFILNSGYQYSIAGENLAKGFYFNNNVLEAWMASPTHKENILRNGYEDVGFAIVNGNLNGEETTLVVQMFGKSLGAATVAQQPTTQAKATEVPEPTTPVVTQAVTQAAAQPIAQVITQPVTQAVTQPQVQPYYQPKTTVLANRVTQVAPKFNLFPVLYNINVLFLTLLAGVLLFDFYMTKKLRIARIGGKNLAHFIFIGFIFVGMYIISSGGIIQ